MEMKHQLRQTQKQTLIMTQKLRQALKLLTLPTLELREELKRTRFDERFHVWELEAIRSIATSIGGILDRSRLAEELINHLVALLGVRSAHLYLGDDAASATAIGAFGPSAIDESQLAEAWEHPLYADEVVAIGGKPVVRPMLPLLLLFDHRLIDTSARALLTIIDDILDLSKIEAGRMELIIEQVDLAQ